MISQLRTEHLARGVAVREALSAEKTIIEKSQRDQTYQLTQIDQSKKTSRQQAEDIGKNILVVCDNILPFCVNSGQI